MKKGACLALWKVCSTGCSCLCFPRAAGGFMHEAGRSCWHAAPNTDSHSHILKWSGPIKGRISLFNNWPSPDGVGEQGLRQVAIPAGGNCGELGELLSWWSCLRIGCLFPVSACLCTALHLDLTSSLPYLTIFNLCHHSSSMWMLIVHIANAQSLNGPLVHGNGGEPEHHILPFP